MTKRITRKAGGSMDVPEWIIEFLLYGVSKKNRWARMETQDCFNGVEKIDAREIWELYKDDLMEIYAEKHPGEKPWAYNRFEKPEKKEI